MAYDNIKSHKKTGCYSLSRKIIFGKTTERGQINPLAFLGLKTLSWKIAPGVRTKISFSKKIDEVIALSCKVFPTIQPTYIYNLFSLMGNSYHHSNLLNIFVPNAPFFYPLKTSENLKVFLCFRGVEEACMWSEWVNTVSSRSEYFKNSFIPNAANEWNELNADIRSSVLYIKYFAIHY